MEMWKRMRKSCELVLDEYNLDLVDMIFGKKPVLDEDYLNTFTKEFCGEEKTAVCNEKQLHDEF
eukprot:UC4_evm1s787